MSLPSLHLARPHLHTTQHKYVYEVKVQRFELERVPSSLGAVAVLWTRGSKTAMTVERDHGPLVRVIEYNEERLSLVCTLFRDVGGVANPPFAEKICTFALIEPRTVGKLAGVRTIGKCKMNISPFAAADGAPTAPTPLALELTRNSQRVGTLRLAISCRACPASMACLHRAPASTSAAAPSASLSELSELSMSEMSDDLSEASSACSDASDTARIADLDDWPHAGAQPVRADDASMYSACRHPDEGLPAACPPITPSRVEALPPSAGHLKTQSCAGSPRRSITQPGSLGAGSAMGGCMHAAGAPRPANDVPSTPPGVDRTHDAPCSITTPGTGEPMAGASDDLDGYACPAGPAIAAASPAINDPPCCSSDGRRSSAAGRSSSVLGRGGPVRQSLTAGGAIHAGERSLFEAERKSLEAQLVAAQAMHRKVTSRMEDERQEWAREKLAMRQELASQREALLAAQVRGLLPPCLLPSLLPCTSLAAFYRTTSLPSTSLFYLTALHLPRCLLPPLVSSCRAALAPCLTTP